MYERILKVGKLLNRLVRKRNHFVISVPDDLHHLPRQVLQGKYLVK